MPADQGNESLFIEPFDRHGRLCLRAESQTPRAFTRSSQPTGLWRGHAQLPEKSGHRLATLALLETIAAQLSPNPFVHPLAVKLTSRKAVVVHPSNEEQIELSNHLHQTNAPVPTGDLPDFILRASYALGRNPELAIQEQPMAEELALPNCADSALFTVHTQPEFLFQNPPHLSHHSSPLLPPSNLD